MAFSNAHFGWPLSPSAARRSALQAASPGINTLISRCIVESSRINKTQDNSPVEGLSAVEAVKVLVAGMSL